MPLVALIEERSSRRVNVCNGSIAATRAAVIGRGRKPPLLVPIEREAATAGLKPAPPRTRPDFLRLHVNGDEPIADIGLRVGQLTPHRRERFNDSGSFVRRDDPARGVEAGCARL